MTVTPEVSRRRFLTYVIAGPTVVAAARWADAGTGGMLAAADMQPIPSAPGAADTYDLNDLLTDATLPTANLITVTMNTDGTASFALPRAEVGQGITTVDRDADRRGARPPARQGARHARRRPARAAVQPAHRRLEHDASRSTRRSGSPPRLRASGCCSTAAATQLGRRRRDLHAQRRRRHGSATAAPSTYGDARRQRPPRRRPRQVDGRRSSRRRSSRVDRHAAQPRRRARRPSPAARSSRWTCTSRTRCRRWSAGRRRSTARSKRSRNLAQVRRCPASPTSR